MVILVSKLSVPGEGDPEVPTNLGRRRGSAVNLHMLAGNFSIFFQIFLIKLDYFFYFFYFFSFFRFNLPFFFYKLEYDKQLETTARAWKE